MKVVHCLCGASVAMFALATMGAQAAETAQAQNEPPKLIHQMPQEFHTSKTTHIDVRYLLFLPEDYKRKESERWPLILFLHGAGERGTDIARVAIHGPPRNLETNANFPFVVVSPQCPEGRGWDTEELTLLLDDVLKRYRIDERRVYLTGLSMGGYGTWKLGMTYPERFAAIAPICGGGELITVLLSSRDKKQALETMGIWAFHGGKDPVVPLAESQRMVDAVKRAGVQDVKFTIYPEAGHNSWVEAYNDPELYKWFLAHKRESVPKPGRKE